MHMFLEADVAMFLGRDDSFPCELVFFENLLLFICLRMVEWVCGAEGYAF